ncbi:hypothetical protein ABEB36_013984 [Hypothenemus hampei]|uniref:Uncharacterized protein n=1 Tax=Hypothenemus hampei TaxID=57062 RepID=A0ABD1E2Z5_HYPHA
MNHEVRFLENVEYHGKQTCLNTLMLKNLRRLLGTINTCHEYTCCLTFVPLYYYYSIILHCGHISSRNPTVIAKENAQTALYIVSKLATKGHVMTSCYAHEFFLWDYVKQKAYVNNHRTIPELNDEIRRVINEAPQNLCRIAIENVIQRV